MYVCIRVRGKSLIGIAREVRAALINADNQSPSRSHSVSLSHTLAGRARVRPRDFDIYRDSARCRGWGGLLSSPPHGSRPRGYAHAAAAREKGETGVCVYGVSRANVEFVNSRVHTQYKSGNLWSPLFRCMLKLIVRSLIPLPAIRKFPRRTSRLNTHTFVHAMRFYTRAKDTMYIR